MRQIKLTQNKVAFVDDDIYKLLEDVPFHAMLSRGRYYARSNRELLQGKRHTYLHWIVIAPSFHKSFQIKFKDGNTLNCQHDNLEYVEKSVNTQTTSKKQLGRKKSSKYLGVSIDCDIKRLRNKRWGARIKHEGKTHMIGRFLTESEAAEAYNKKAIELFGLSAKLNRLEYVQ